MKRQLEEVEEVYPEENVQVVQPEQVEPASVVYPVQEVAEVRHHEHEVNHESSESSESIEEVDNADEHFEKISDEDLEMTTLANEVTTVENEAEMTTTFDYFDEADPARENEDAPVLLESSWEEKEVVIQQKINQNNCMEMNNDLFINIMSTLVTTVTQFHTKIESNTVLFKAEGGCLPNNVDEIFTSSCM